MHPDCDIFSLYVWSDVPRKEMKGGLLLLHCHSVRCWHNDLGRLETVFLLAAVDACWLEDHRTFSLDLWGSMSV
jgi:hypothetical protein